MILHLIANYNRKAGFFGGIMPMNIEPDVLKKDYVQIIANLSKADLEKLKEIDVYSMGTYDNVSGEIIASKEFLLHADEAVKILLADEVKEDARK